MFIHVNANKIKYVQINTPLVSDIYFYFVENC